MSLKIEEREDEGITVLDLDGPLTVRDGAAELRERLAGLQQAGKINIVLNLKKVRHIDSTGVGTLVFALARLSKSGGKLALTNLHREHLELLVLSKLALTFDLFENEHDAVDSFFADRAVKKFDVLEFVRGQENNG